MHQRHKVPQHPKQEPGPGEGGGEEKELVAPLHVQEGGPEVTYVQGAPPTDVLDAHVAPPILGEHTPPPPQGPAPARAPAAQQGLQNVRLRLGVTHLLGGGATGGRGCGGCHL